VRALVTGITGQDGSYLGEFLLDKGYEVYGMVRRSSVENFNRIEHIRDKLKFVQADLLDQLSIIDAIKESRPDEIYNLGAMSFVPISWKQPVLTGEFTGLGVTRMLEAARHMNKNVKFYQASSSEMFGKVREIPQNEKTPFYPCSPYGVAKVYGHYMTVNYRESYDMFACSGILFNHESPRRGLEFVTKKVTYGAAKIKLGLTDSLYLGNLDAKRDWGYAKDYIEAMWLMLQQDTPEDYVISTGEAHSVEEWVEASFQCLDLDWGKYVKIDKSFIRPVDVDLLVGDSSKARKKLAWKTKVSFNELVKIMVEYDYNYLKKQM
jgi:GDPmannose 4,6-dehydratase